MQDAAEIDRILLRGAERAREIAAPILFLLDEAQSSYVTGQVLSVDGGFMAAGMISGTSEAGNRNA